FFRLSSQSTLSERTKQMQQRTMFQLIIQTIIPLMIQWLPLIVYCYSVITSSLNPDVVNLLFCFQLSHAFVHTAILIIT
ncbi:hypothetical protein PMAYCL1PPCAC_21991, partial [Pristionchus mayeri]